MTAYISVRVRDHSDEYSVVRFPVDEMLLADVWGDVVAKGAALRAQVDALSLGTTVNWTFSQDAETPDDNRPADDAAQRETGLRVFYHGNISGKKAHLTIPAADLGAVELQPGSDLAIMTEEPIAGFITVFEAQVSLPMPNTPPSTGYWNDDVTVDRIQFVGRST